MYPAISASFLSITFLYIPYKPGSFDPPSSLILISGHSYSFSLRYPMEIKTKQPRDFPAPVTVRKQKDD
jgi:hypothetical protein